MKFLFFDTETTGYLNEYSHIVQLAALLTDEETPVSHINVLIKSENWTVPDRVVEVHGITTEKCHEYGIPISVALSLLDSLAEQSDIVVAHNYPFDCGMVKLERDRLGLPPGSHGASFCTMTKSTDIVKLPGPRGFKWPRLQEAYQFFFGEEFEGAHDAMADVHACSKVFFELRRRGVA